MRRPLLPVAPRRKIFKTAPSIIVAGHRAEQYDDDVVEVRDQETGCCEAGSWWETSPSAPHAADDEGAHETDGPQDRHCETNAPAVHRRIDPMIFRPQLDGFFDDNFHRAYRRCAMKTACVGLPWLHNAKSGLIYGVGDDAAYIAQKIITDDREISRAAIVSDKPEKSWLSHDFCCS
jgi:hypothetical protein